MAIRRIIIAIDGYSACGKSTTAREVARILGYRYFDTGAMYRAVTLHFVEHHVPINDPEAVGGALARINLGFRMNRNNFTDTLLNGRNVEHDIRGMAVSELVSEVSTIKQVRNFLVQQQRYYGQDKGVVMDGRDIGTVVFPRAELKVFMTAEITVRAYRRQKELLDKRIRIDLDDVIDNIVARDRLDASRQESPLRKAENAVTLDTTFLTIDEQVDIVLWNALSRILDYP